MDRKAISVARLAVVALLAVMAAVGCANRGGGGAMHPAGYTPAAQSSQADTAAGAPTATPTPVDTAAASPTNEPGASNAPDATADPVAGDLSDLDRLLSGINSALSGSDPGPLGGE